MNLDLSVACFFLLALFLSPASTSEPCDERCPTEDKDERFQFADPNRLNLMTWVNASKTCKGLGMTLPIIRSPCEQNLFTSFLHTAGVIEYDIWLGGMSVQDHQWQWLNGSLLDPNNPLVMQKADFGFGYISISPLVKWGNDSSSVQRRFICEFSDQETCGKQTEYSPEHYSPFNSSGNPSVKCYVASKRVSSWYNARTFCRRLGGDLARSSDVINSFSRNNPARNEQFWIGLRQVKWIWVDGEDTNNQDVDMTFFRSSTDVDRTANDSDCMYSLRGEQWDWDSRPCDNSTLHSLLVLCQKKTPTHKLEIPHKSTCCCGDASPNGSHSWKIGTCVLIVITFAFLTAIILLVLYIRRRFIADDSKALSRENNAYVRGVDTAEELGTSTLQTQTIIENADNEETSKKLPTIFSAEQDEEGHGSTLLLFPSAVPKIALPPYSAEIHHEHEHRSNISAFGSLGNEIVTALHPAKSLQTMKTSSSHPVKPKPPMKKTDVLSKVSIQPYSTLAVCGTERPVSLFPQIAGSEATVLPMSQDYANGDIEGGVQKEGELVAVNGAYDILNARNFEAAPYANEDQLRRYQNIKYPTDPDGYLRPNNCEPETSKSNENHSVVAAACANGSHYTNEEGGKSRTTNVNKLTARFSRKPQKQRLPDSVGPTKVAPALRMSAAGKGMRMNCSQPSDKANRIPSPHVYQEIEPEYISIKDETMDVQANYTDDTYQNKDDAEKRKPNWSEDEGAVGY